MCAIIITIFHMFSVLGKFDNVHHDGVIEKSVQYMLAEYTVDQTCDITLLSYRVNHS